MENDSVYVLLYIVEVVLLGIILEDDALCDTITIRNFDLGFAVDFWIGREYGSALEQCYYRRRDYSYESVGDFRE